MCLRRIREYVKMTKIKSQRRQENKEMGKRRNKLSRSDSFVPGSTLGTNLDLSANGR